MKKLIIAIIFIIMISLIIFFCKDYVIRQYFIAKIQNVDYDECIITTNYNGKKRDISYFSENFYSIREYDENEKLKDKIEIYDYDKGMSYVYNIESNEMDKYKINFSRNFYINNSALLLLLKNTKDNSKFIYKGIESINDRECYVLYFEKDKDNFNTIYLDKELLFTLREDVYNANISGKHDILDYNLDLELKQKDLFELDFEE